MSNVGYATLTVTPSLRGFQKTMQGQLGGIMPAAGRRSGRALGSAIGAGAAANTAPVAAAGQRMGRAVTGSMTQATAGSQSAFSRIRAGASGAFSAVTTGAASAGRSIARGVTNGARGADSAITNLGSNIRGMAGVAATATAAMGFVNVGRDIMEVASGAQHTEAVLEGLYGTAGHGAGEAARMMDLLNSEFGRSGIEMQAFQQGATDLAYLGVSAQETADILGFMESTISAAGGSADDLGRVTSALASAQNMGRASMQELNQISQANVPIFDMLSDHMGISRQEIEGLTGSGELLVEDVLGAIQAQGGTWAAGLVDGAENADQTWGSAWDSMKNTLVNGLANQVVPLLDRFAPAVHRMNDSIAGAMEALPERLSRVKSAMENAGVMSALRTIGEGAKELFNGMKPFFAAFATGAGAALGALVIALEPVGALLASLGRWLQENSEVVKTFGMVLGGLVAIVVAFKAAIAIGGAIAALANPVGLVVVAIAALAAGLKYAWENSETFRDIVTGAWDAIKTAASAVASFFMDNVWPKLESFWEMLTGKAGEVGGFFSEIWEKASEVFETFAELLTVLWETHGEKLMHNITTTMEIISAIWDGAWTVIKAVFSGAWEIMTSILSGALEIIGGILDVFIGVLTGDWERAWEGVQEIFSGAWEIITGIISGATEIIGGLLTGMWEIITGVFTAIYEWVVNGETFTGMVESVTGFFSSMWEGISGFMSAIASTISTVWSTIVSTVSEWVASLVSAVSSGWSTVQAWTSSAWAAVLGVISSVWSSITGAVSSAVSSVRTTISNAWSTVRSLTSSAWSAIRSSVSTAATNLLTTVRNIPTRIYNVFSNIGSRMKTVGRNIVTGIINGVTGSASRLTTRLRNLASNALSAAKRALGISSPSKVFRDEVGGEIVAGLIGGLAAGERAVQSSMDSLVAGRPTAPKQRNLIGEAQAQSNAARRESALTMERLSRSLNSRESGDIVIQVDSREVARANRKGNARLARR